MTIATAEGILTAACRYALLTPAEVRSRKRTHRYARTRQAICTVLRERTAWSLPQIGRFVGLKDHTTVIHSIDMAPEFAAREPWFAGLLDALRSAEPMVLVKAREIEREVAKERMRRVVKAGSGLRAMGPYTGPIKLKPEPKFERVEYYGGRHFLIDDDGFEYGERDARKVMRAASMDLAAAIRSQRTDTP